MKRNRLARPLLLLLSLLMLLGIFSTASAEGSTNLLQNPGFEEIGADGLPVGWKTDAYLNLEGVTFYTVSDNAMSGAHSVQIENLDYNDARFCQTVATACPAMSKHGIRSMRVWAAICPSKTCMSSPKAYTIRRTSGSTLNSTA